MTRRNTLTLAQIAKAIKTLEKRSIQNVIEIGKLLHEASEQCEHGEYMKWLETEFDWSHSTALNYRNVYDLTQNRKSYDFAKLDISTSALYLVARLLKDGSSPIVQAAGDAVLKCAAESRVGVDTAKIIIENHLGSAEFNEEHYDEMMVPSRFVGRSPADNTDADDTAESDEPDNEPADDAEPLQAQPPADAESTAADIVEERREAEEDLRIVTKQMLAITEDDPAWPIVVAEIGAPELLKLIQMLQAVYDEHCKESDVKLAADRAENKTKARLH